MPKNAISRAAALSGAMVQTCDLALQDALKGIPRDHPAIKALEEAKLELRRAERILTDTLRRLEGGA